MILKLVEANGAALFWENTLAEPINNGTDKGIIE